MNKKIQYQIQILQSKIIQYNENIAKLNDSKIQLETTNRDNSLNSSKSNNLLKIIELQNQNSYILDKQKLLKNNILKLKNELKNNIQQLNNLDKINDSKFIEEEIIYKEELLRINLQIIEVNNNFNNSIKIANIEKIELYNNIELLKNELNIQNDIITEIQINSHSSRKNILKDLHQQKQNKIFTNQQIDNCKDNKNFYCSQITLLENKILNLIDFKILIINTEYNTEYNTESNYDKDKDKDKDKLLNYYDEFKEYDLNTLSNNDKIVKIDNIIKYNQDKIILIKNKSEKHMKLNNIKINDIIENYNKKDRIKVIGYKDQYKVEKQKRDNINIILNDMCSRYDTYEQNIIGDINNKLSIDINDIENDKIRAYDRLNITKLRITENHNNEKIRINSLIDNNKLDLDNFGKEFINLTLELDNVNLMIKNENSFINELTKINNEISKYQELIQQIQKDLDNISNSI